MTLSKLRGLVLPLGASVKLGKKKDKAVNTPQKRAPVGVFPHLLSVDVPNLLAVQVRKHFSYDILGAYLHFTHHKDFVREAKEKEKECRSVTLEC